jgi:hypothetical protein
MGSLAAHGTVQLYIHAHGSRSVQGPAPALVCVREANSATPDRDPVLCWGGRPSTITHNESCRLILMNIYEGVAGPPARPSPCVRARGGGGSRTLSSQVVSVVREYSLSSAWASASLFAGAATA